MAIAAIADAVGKGVSSLNKATEIRADGKGGLSEAVADAGQIAESTMDKLSKLSGDEEKEEKKDHDDPSGNKKAKETDDEMKKGGSVIQRLASGGEVDDDELEAFIATDDDGDELRETFSKMKDIPEPFAQALFQKAPSELSEPFVNSILDGGDWDENMNKFADRVVEWVSTGKLPKVNEGKDNDAANLPPAKPIVETEDPAPTESAFTEERDLDAEREAILKAVTRAY